jgi:hypothetical protein
MPLGRRKKCCCGPCAQGILSWKWCGATSQSGLSAPAMSVIISGFSSANSPPFICCNFAGVQQYDLSALNGTYGLGPSSIGFSADGGFVASASMAWRKTKAVWNLSWGNPDNPPAGADEYFSCTGIGCSPGGTDPCPSVAATCGKYYGLLSLYATFGLSCKDGKYVAGAAITLTMTNFLPSLNQNWFQMIVGSDVIEAKQGDCFEVPAFHPTSINGLADTPTLSLSL